jgi:hypothetical protein
MVSQVWEAAAGSEGMSERVYALAGRPATGYGDRGVTENHALCRYFVDTHRSFHSCG